MASVAACDGRCCTVFKYTVTPEQIQVRLDAGRGYADDQTLVDMLIPLTPQEAFGRALAFGVKPPEGFTLRSWTESGPTYTCRHFDPDTRLCKIYDSRPRMCADYPYARKCDHGCEGCAPQSVIDEYLAHYKEADSSS